MSKGEERAARLSVHDAKESLRHWASLADQEIVAEIALVKAKARKFAPWAAGAAVLMGVLIGKRGRRGAVVAPVAAVVSRGPIGLLRRAVGMATAAIGVARVVVPIVNQVRARRGRSNSPPV